MKLFTKVLIAGLLCLSNAANAQTPSVLPKTGSKYQQDGTKGWYEADSGLLVPRFNAKKSPAGILFNKPGRFWYDMLGDSSMHYWDGVHEFKLYSEKDGVFGGGGSTTPGGSTWRIQFNLNGVFGGARYLTYHSDTLRDSTVSIFSGPNYFSGPIGFFHAPVVLQQSGNIGNALRNYGLITSPSIDVGDINAIGTPDNTTFLRGDGRWSVPSGGAVSSVFGRTGIIVPVSGDYNYSQILGATTAVHDTANDVRGLAQENLDDTAALKVKYLDSNTIYATPYRTDSGVKNTRIWSLATFLQSFTESDPIAIAKTVTVGTSWGLSGGGAAQALNTNPSRTLSADSFSVASRNRLQKIVDSIINIGYLTSESDPVANAKTVTIATGYGLTGGGSSQALSVNPSRTIVADSTLLSTKGNRQKGIDSVAALIVAYTVTYGLAMSVGHNIVVDSFVIASKNRLYKVRDSLVGIGYLTAETDPIANAKTVTIGSGWGITGGGASQALSTNPSRTLVADSTVISTWGYRKKGDDSVAAIAATKLAASQIVTLNGAVAATGVITAPLVTTLNASVVGTVNLSATGTPSSTTFLRGDNTWSVPAGGGGTGVNSIVATSPLQATGTTTVTISMDASYGVQTITATSYSVSCTPTTSVTATTSTVYFDVTAQAGALLFNAPTGTWAHHQHLQITVKDNGTARALTYNSIYRAGTTVTAPTTTTLSKELKLLYEYNANATKFDLLDYVEGY